MSRSAWGAWDTTDRGRRGSEHVLDSGTDDVHSALVPPGALHNRVTTALANWRLDDAEALLAGLERDPSPYVAAAPRADGSEEGPGSLGQAWADTLRAELLVRRLRVAGFTLVGEPVSHDATAEPALDLHAGVAELIEGGPGKDADPRAESASRAALAIALVRSAKAASANGSTHRAGMNQLFSRALRGNCCVGRIGSSGLSGFISLNHQLVAYFGSAPEDGVRGQFQHTLSPKDWPGHPEGAGLDDLDPREEPVEMVGDDVLHGHEALQ